MQLNGSLPIFLLDIFSAAPKWRTHQPTNIASTEIKSLQSQEGHETVQSLSFIQFR